MTPKKIAVIVFILISALAGNAMAEGKKDVWKIATLAPKGIGWAKNVMNNMLPSIEEATDNNLAVNIFWGGIMGDDEDYIKKMRIGQLQGMGCSAQGFILAIPESAVLSLPFIFESWDEVDYIRKVMYPTFETYAEKNGFKLLYWIDQDFDQLYSTNWPLDRLEDFSQVKFIAWLGPLESAVFDALGASAVPINVPEAAAAIRQGIINAHICPSVWIVGAQVYTVYKYVNPAKIRYSPAGIVISSDAWEALPESHRRNLMSTRMAVIDKFCGIARADNQKAIDAMVNYGMKLVEPDPAVFAKVKETSQKVWYEQADKLYPKGLLDEVLFQLERYRKMKAGDSSSGMALR